MRYVPNAGYRNLVIRLQPRFSKTIELMPICIIDLRDLIIQYAKQKVAASEHSVDNRNQVMVLRTEKIARREPCLELR